jgi:hypothetical protein
VVLAVLIVVLVAATGVFVALWLKERSEYDTTLGRLDTVRTEAADAKKKLDTAQTRKSDAVSKRSEAESSKREYDAAAQQEAKCADAARAMVRAALNHDQKAAREAGGQLPGSCP